MQNTFQPGDFIVTHGSDLFDILIRVFTNSNWNHAALIVSKEGDLIELTNSGIKQSHINNYKQQDRFVVNIEMNRQDRDQVLEYANYMLSKHDKYGFLTIFTIGLKIITKSRFIIKLDGTLICSEFVARALSQGGFIWDQDPALITPADLYNKFESKGTHLKKEV